MLRRDPVLRHRELPAHRERHPAHQLCEELGLADVLAYPTNVRALGIMRLDSIPERRPSLTSVVPKPYGTQAAYSPFPMSQSSDAAACL